MADIRRRYFVATGPDAQALVGRLRTFYDEHAARFQAFSKKYGAALLRHREGLPEALLVAPGAPVQPGFKLTSQTEYLGKTYDVHEIKGTSKAAWTARHDAKAVGRLGVSDKICDHYGLRGRMLLAGGTSAWLAVGWANLERGLVTLSVPEDAGHRYEPANPELLEITYEQYKAVSEGGPAPALTPRAESKPLPRYTCKGKGGTYELEGIARGAGTSRDQNDLVVYRDVDSGLLFFRSPEDFAERMEVLP